VVIISPVNGAQKKKRTRIGGIVDKDRAERRRLRDGRVRDPGIRGILAVRHGRKKWLDREGKKGGFHRVQIEIVCIGHHLGAGN